MLPYNYKIEAGKNAPGEVALILNGRCFSTDLAEVEISDKYVTFKDSNGSVIRQHIKKVT